MKGGFSGVSEGQGGDDEVKQRDHAPEKKTEKYCGCNVEYDVFFYTHFCAPFLLKIGFLLVYDCIIQKHESLKLYLLTKREKIFCKKRRNGEADFEKH